MGAPTPPEYGQAGATCGCKKLLSSSVLFKKGILAMDTIPVRVEETSTQGPYGEVLGPATATGIRHLDVGKLRESLSRLSEQISEVLRDIKKVGDFRLKEVEVQVEISSEGGVNLVGTVKAGVKGAITLTFAEPSQS